VLRAYREAVGAKSGTIREKRMKMSAWRRKEYCHSWNGRAQGAKRRTEYLSFVVKRSHSWSFVGRQSAKRIGVREEIVICGNWYKEYRGKSKAQSQGESSIQFDFI